MNDASRIHCNGSIQIEVFHDAIQALCSYQGSHIPFVVDLCQRTRAEDCAKTTGRASHRSFPPNSHFINCRQHLFRGILLGILSLLEDL